MRRIHVTENLQRALLIRHALENHGIPATILGEHTSFAATSFGGMLERRLEVWVLDEQNAGEAEHVIEALFADDGSPPGDGWTCPNCGEKIEADFTTCWQCGHAQEGLPHD